MLSFITGCNGGESISNYGNDYQLVNDNIIDDPDSTDYNGTNNNDEDSEFGYEGFDQIPYAFFNHSINVNEISLIDLSTADTITSVTFDEYDIVKQIWNLSNGYIVVFVGHEELNARYSRLRRNEGIFELGDFILDERKPDERNMRIILLDKELNIVNTIAHDDFRIENINYSNGNIYAFYWVSRDLTNPSSFHDLFKVDLLANEVIVVKENTRPFQIMGFVNEDLAIVSMISGCETGERFIGLKDLNTNENFQFDIDFSPRDFVRLGDKWIITEANTRWFGGEIYSQVYIFDTHSMSGRLIQLIEEDSYWARLTVSGNYIIAVDQLEAVFRKYDLSGNVLSEIGIYLAYNFNWFEIFSLSDYKSLIVTRVLGGKSHFQIIDFN